MAATDAMMFPTKNTALRIPVSFRLNDGTLATSWTGADTQLSLDGAAYAAATNEATEISTSGTGYLDLTAGEMNADMIWVKTTITNTDALPFVLAIMPQRTTVPVFSAAQSIAADAITSTALAASATAEIADAVWDEALAGHLTPGSAGEALDAAGTAGDPWTTALPGAYGPGTAGAILGNPLTVGALSAGTITAASIATGAIDADALAADAVAELADGVWDELLAGHVGAGTAGLALADASTGGDPAAIATAVWDLADGIETDWTPRQTLRVIAASTAGVNSGNELSTPNYRNLPNTKGRVTAQLDAAQNRTSVTYDPD